MLVISGTSAISEFRREKALEQLKNRLNGCSDISANHIYLVDLEHPLDGKEDVVARLLNLERLDSPDVESGTGYAKRIIVPRIGTISPWATKATDIFHHCGVAQVRRIERGVSWMIYGDFGGGSGINDNDLAGILYDPMTESLLLRESEAESLFDASDPAPLLVVDILGGGLDTLSQANQTHGFALSAEEQIYLVDQFNRMGRNPTDVELMMFAQVNSEHCRHKIFNADWDVDGELKNRSLFSMIRQTHEQRSEGTLSAYSDNAAVLEGAQAERFAPDLSSRVYAYTPEPVHITVKVETHNHPTAISPFPGASTGSGGEIRDEGATGRGGKPKAGLVGYSVSHLRIPGRERRWESPERKPQRIASPLQIMLEGPIGAAAFNNEFGRPNIAGYFRNFETPDDGTGVVHGYHKPIMLAGGLGNVRPQHVQKESIPDQTPIVVLGGPTMLIGLGGGAASSVASGSSSEELDFASVQRGNPEMQRRCQEVIDTCCALGDDNPILSIHDIGAGGLCNALPELVHDSGRGGRFELRDVLNDEPGMSPMQIWCNESQERYVVAVKAQGLDLFENICHRERCLYSKVGSATDSESLSLHDRHFGVGDYPDPIDLPMEVLFGLPPKMHRSVESVFIDSPVLDIASIDVKIAVELVLTFPAVADKTFLVSIGDRSVTGLIARDQMVGPWQVPVSDVAVTASGYRGNAGEAFAIGERTPLAVIDAPASGRMAIGEAVTNIAAAAIDSIGDIRLSANWMVAAGEPGHDADLYDTVDAVATELCPALGISIPVGKDSMSMKTVWHDESGDERKVVSPVSLVVSAFAPVQDIRRTLTPQLHEIESESSLYLVDLGAGHTRLGGSVLAQATGQMGNAVPDLMSPDLLKGLFAMVQELAVSQTILAYHDRSDGGLITTLLEMAFASRCGLDIDLDFPVKDPLEILFNEELGAVVQVAPGTEALFEAAASRHGLGQFVHRIGRPVAGENISVCCNDETCFQASRMDCHRLWSETTWQMQRLRDNPACADEEYDRILDGKDSGMFVDLTFDHERTTNIPESNSGMPATGRRPRVAILREQGVNGQLEMAAAFDAAGFESVDVTMSDLAGGENLDGFSGMAACGGFSFGDVLGAGEGWGKSILYNSRLKDTFQDFFNRSDTFALGVCNGCQMMSSIKDIIPGASHWPRFLRNRSEQYEARYVMVEVCSEKSVLLSGMAGSRLPVVVAHGEGRAEFEARDHLDHLEKSGQVTLRFIDHGGNRASTYPLNPNGSPEGVTGFTTDDGRFTIMMPHPERVFRTVSNSWHPGTWGEFSPWIEIFRNARHWLS